MSGIDPTFVGAWIVTITLIVAAVIDGIQLKVPNWLTFSMIVTGWIFSSVAAYYAGTPWYVGLGWSFAGTIVGLLLLMPAYAIGGMGAGDVKLMAGIGAWMQVTITLESFAVSAVIGGVLALVMVACKRAYQKHSKMFVYLLKEMWRVKDPVQLATIASARKPQMFLLPYGIPIAIGTIGYLAWGGLLF